MYCTYDPGLLLFTYGEETLEICPQHDSLQAGVAVMASVVLLGLLWLVS
ncbi:hypothetical protein CLG85_023780 [Yangia mangrovi]|uniref:Uncharacterized protein n=1 Tax=Alloyangia mangrovi TaxID=1779329 RepID=A0ABT2KQN7_9RHOB|nr:hypothetical protein [Alloyangia mangrovi]MCT4373149.1 hypothetical protein [Alloyangia mangrovi]